MTQRMLCRGGDLELCESCARNVASHDHVPSGQRYIKPCIDPPRCGDWLAAPSIAEDASHDRL